MQSIAPHISMIATGPINGRRSRIHDDEARLQQLVAELRDGLPERHLHGGRRGGDDGAAARVEVRVGREVYRLLACFLEVRCGGLEVLDGFRAVYVDDYAAEDFVAEDAEGRDGGGCYGCGDFAAGGEEGGVVVVASRERGVCVAGEGGVCVVAG